MRLKESNTSLNERSDDIPLKPVLVDEKESLYLVEGAPRLNGFVSLKDEYLPEEYIGKQPDCLATKNNLRCSLDDTMYIVRADGWKKVDVELLVPRDDAGGGRNLAASECQINYLVDSTTSTGTEWQVEWDWVGSSTYTNPPNYKFHGGTGWSLTPNFECSSSHDPYAAKIRFGEERPSGGKVLRTEWACGDPGVGDTAYVQLKVDGYAFWSSQELDIYFWKGYRIEVLQSSSSATGSITASIGTAFGGSFGAGTGTKTWANFCVILGDFLICEVEDYMWSAGVDFLVGMDNSIHTGAGSGLESIQC